VVALLASTAAFAADSPYQLVDVTYGLGSERVTAVVVHPRDADVALVGVDGRVLKTEDGGENWHVVLGFRIGNSDIDNALDDAESEAAELPRGDSDFAAESGTTVQFEPYALPDGDIDLAPAAAAAVESVGLAPAAEALPEGSNEVDEVAVFARTLSGVRAIVFTPSDPEVVYAATPIGLFRSVNRGEQWDEVALPKLRNASDVRDVAVSPTIPTYIVAATHRGAVESSDGGFSWNPVSGRPGMTPALSVAILPNATSTILIGSNEGIFRSDDGGKTYQLQLIAEGGRSQAVSSIAYDQPRGLIYVGTGRGLYRGAEIESVYNPVDLGAAQPIEHVATGSDGSVVAAGDRGLFRVDPESEQVENLLAEGDVPGAVDVAIDPRRPQVMWIATEHGLYRRMKGSGETSVRLARRRLDEIVKREPTVDEVMRATVSHFRVDAARFAAMSNRADLSALLPKLEVRLDWRRGQEEGYGWGLMTTEGRSEAEILDDLGATYGDVFFDPPYYVQNRNYTQVWVAARWDLDRLIMRPETMRVSFEEQRYGDYRNRLSTRVIKLYESRRRALQSVVAHHARDRKAEAKRLLKLLEYTALLDVMTGGFFVREARARGGESMLGVSYDGSAEVAPPPATAAAEPAPARQ